jgi:hypothetical protein
LACGLGLSNVHVWNVVIGLDEDDNVESSWTLIYDQPTSGNTINYLNMPIGGMYVHSQSNDRNVRCWNLNEPWTKIFYDIDGTSKHGMLGFVASQKSTAASNTTGTERIVIAAENGLQLREITKDGYSATDINVAKTAASSSSSTSSCSSRRSKHNQDHKFIQASVIESKDNSCIAIAYTPSGTLFTNYSDPKNILQPILTLRSTENDRPHVLLTECSYDGDTEPVIAIIDNRGVGGALNVLRIAPLSYYTNGQREAKTEATETRRQPLCGHACMAMYLLHVPTLARPA